MKSKDQQLLEEAYGLICELHDETGSLTGPTRETGKGSGKRYVIHFNGKNGKEIYNWVDKNQGHTACLYYNAGGSSFDIPPALANRVRSISEHTLKGMVQDQVFSMFPKDIALIVPSDATVPEAVTNRFEKLDIGTNKKELPELEGVF